MANERIDYSFQSWTINELYGSNIINLVPTQAPYENLWYRDNFDMAPWRADRRIWLEGRKWFRNQWENTISDGIVTDVQGLDWNVYYLVKTSEDVIELHAICDDIISNNNCGSDLIIDCDAEYTWNTRLISSHPSSECMYDKFIRQAYVKNPKCRDSAITVETDAAWTYYESLTCAAVWDFVVAEYSTAASIMWQVRIVVSIVWSKYYLSDPLIWIWSWWQTATVGVYSDYEDTLLFASWNGIRAIVKTDACSVLTIDNEYTTIYGNTNTTAPFDITSDDFMTTSMFNYQWQVWFLGYKWNKQAGFVNFWLFWFNSWYFTPLSSYQIPGDYKWWLEYNNLIILFSQTRIWYLSRSSTINALTSAPEISFANLTNSFGAYWPDTLITHLGDIILLTNKKKLYNLGIEYYGNDAFGVALFRPKVVDLGKYLQFELSSISFANWDVVKLKQDNDKIAMFINNPFQHDESLSWGLIPSDTTVCIFDSINKFWYKWIVCGVEISWYVDNLYYGKGMFIYCGDKDNATDEWLWGTNIKQLLWAIVDVWPMTTKTLNVIKWTIWDRAIISDDNTRIRLYTNMGWTEYMQEHDRFSKLEYVKNLNWESTEEECCILQTVYNRNDVDDVITPSYINMTEWYCEYSEETNNKPVNTSTWEDESLQSEYNVNSNDTNLNGTMRVGRYSTWGWNVQSEWEQMTIEILAKDWDKMHTSWLEMLYELSGGLELINSGNSLSILLE